MRSLLFILLLVALLAGVGYYVFLSSDYGAKNFFINKTAEQEKMISDLKITDKRFKIEKRNYDYIEEGMVRIDVSYPFLDHKNNVIEFAFNNAIKKNILDSVDDFKDFAETEPEFEIYDEFYYYYDFDYEIMHETDSIISILMTGSQYTGGAHPNSMYYSILYDTYGGSVLEINDIFNKNSDYLNKLSNIVIDELVKRDISDAEWIEDGAGPKKDNYEVFYVRNGALYLIFPPYQVASYVAGAQTVRIPLSELHDILKVSL